MSDIRTVTLELVREGPPDNRLLSPLTPYLALCGQFETATVHVPYEHRVFLRRLDKLRYRQGALDDPVARQAILDEVAADLARILGSIPGLQSSLATDGAETEMLTHLNLVISPAELALLPFELSRVPTGFSGGEGNWLSLQTRAPIVLTRQIRSAVGSSTRWPAKPKILFVASASGGSIPFDAHLQALLKAIQPWVEPYDENKEGDFEAKVGKILKLLPDATMAQIQEACARETFTHIHVLAHGMEDRRREGNPFGLALAASRDASSTDVVSGARFATAIRPLKSKTAHPPAIVTVASCDSDNKESMVIYNVASFAHELHQAGVPVVVASQFPLSKAGSVRVAELLYERLLWGDDPRKVFHDLRRQLYSLHAQDAHDWASLVVYANLPIDLASQLEDTRYEQAKAAINAALNALDREIAGFDNTPDTGGEKAAALNRTMETLLERADAAAAKMPTEGAYETEGLGMKASTEKRKAQMRFQLALKLQSAQHLDRARSELGESLEVLVAARSLYWQAARQNMIQADRPLKRKRSLHWVMVQQLSLEAVLGESLTDAHRDCWSAARTSALADLEGGDRSLRAWAHGSLL
ncbi:MAG: CHAT domain-containing protein, partial [Thermoanaerobaculia bacterium]|nr:CHAT domain-containing protein [Thermoanaerobaculia bacterium]